MGMEIDAMMHWEYKLIDLPTKSESSEGMNAYGSEGWELVGFENISGNMQRLIFKRPVFSNETRMLGVS